MKSAMLHDAYAADYDSQAEVYQCYIGDVLFGLCYAYIQPGQTLLDAGIGSGLSAYLFKKAGLDIYGMDFSAAMLSVCIEKGIASDLTEHDLNISPWPYETGKFDHLICCGVLHFISDLKLIFIEAARVLIPGGLFAFSTKDGKATNEKPEKYTQHLVGDFDVFSHSEDYIESLLHQRGFQVTKQQKCMVGEDLFILWVTRKKD